jgi:hypothetical protein
MTLKFQDVIFDYFDSYSRKDSESLEKFFSEDIMLVDWNINIKGKAKVLAEIQKTFDSTISIKVIPKSFYANSDYLYAIHISILVDNEKYIDVIDVIEFNFEGKILMVNAFKYENNR